MLERLLVYTMPVSIKMNNSTNLQSVLFVTSLNPVLISPFPVFGCLIGAELSRASVRTDVDVRDAFSMLKACKHQIFTNQHSNI